MGGQENGRPRMLSPREAVGIAGELTEEELAAGRLQSLCLKWVADEAETLTEASLRLREFAEWLVDPEKRLADPA